MRASRGFPASHNSGRERMTAGEAADLLGISTAELHKMIGLIPRKRRPVMRNEPRGITYPTEDIYWLMRLRRIPTPLSETDWLSTYQKENKDERADP